MTVDIGSLVAGYRIEGVLGRGGMGVVYEAHQLSLDRPVALKILSPELSADDAFRERFRREGLIQARIDHPHIVPIYEAGEHAGGLFLAMRIVRGPTLKDLIAMRELEGARTLRILRPIGDALEAAHDVGLIHRDIKPQNILVGSRDHAFLADFGLTKGPTEQRSLTKTGQFVGTLDYISPEQIRGESATTRSDVYSLAAVLFECLTGVVPYPKESDAAVLFAHMAEPPPLVTDQRPDLPPDLDAVLLRAMSKNPAERPESPTALLGAAERAFGRRVRAVITPPMPIELPEEGGIRRAEQDVTTHETRVRHLPAGTPMEAPALATDGAAPVARAPAGPTRPAPAVVEAMPAPETVAAPDVAAPHVPAPDVPASSTQHVIPLTPGREERAGDAPDADNGPALPDQPGATRPARERQDNGGEPAPGAGTRPPEAPPEPGGPTAETQIVPAPNEATKASPAPAGATRRSASRPSSSADGAAAPTVEVRPRAAAASLSGAATVPQRVARPRAAQRRLVAAGAVAMLLFAVAFLAGRSGGVDAQDPPPPRAAPPPALASSASSGAVELRFPSGWRRTASPPRIPGLAIDDQVALTGPTGARVVAGRTRATGPALLPATLLERLADPPRRDDRVRLGGLTAYRYKGIDVRGLDRPLTLLVVPTTAGVATVACLGAVGGSRIADACERIAGSIGLVRGRPIALGPDRIYAKRLNRATARLNRSRSSLGRQLARARSRSGQARRAGDLAAAYAAASRSIDRAGRSVGPAARPGHDAVVGAVSRGERAYRSLAAAARHGQARRYRAARRDVARADRAVAAALASLRPLGYVVR